MVYFLSWLIPGWGFWLLGYKKRAIVNFFVVISLFFLGILMKGNVWPRTTDVMAICSLTGMLGSGIFSLGYLVIYFVFVKMFAAGWYDIGSWTEIGNTYLTVAGVLNFLVVCKLSNFEKKNQNVSAAGIQPKENN